MKQKNAAFIANLLDILESKEESIVLGEKVLTELFYRILIGKNSKIAKTLKCDMRIFIIKISS